MGLAKDLSYFLSDEAKERKVSPLKEILKYRNVPGVRSLGGGLPIPELFPFDNLRVKNPAFPFADGIAPSKGHEIDTQESVIHKFKVDENDLDIPFDVSLQYGSGLGSPEIVEFIKEHMSRMHKIAFDDWEVLLTIGNTYAWDSVLRTVTNRGDVILCEEFCFTSALETARSQGLVTVGVEMDLEGIIPEALEVQLANWVGPRPKLLYTVPTGQNPTGSSLSAERRKKVYELAQKYDFLIIEDEPYFYLQFPEYEFKESRQPAEQLVDPEQLSKAVDAMIKSSATSFLNFDTDGRVMRLDSFSKVIAPGTRMGWITAQKKFIERLFMLAIVTTQSCCGFSLSIMNSLFQRWGQDGYWAWLYKLKDVYLYHRDVACDAIHKYFPKGKYDFVPPVSGMFFWFRIDSRRFKGFKECDRDPKKCENAIWQLAMDKNVLLVPGHFFLCDGKTNPPQKELPQDDTDKYAMTFRGTFAGVTDEILESSLKDVGAVLTECLTDDLQE